jgi:LPS-assembly protein
MIRLLTPAFDHQQEQTFGVLSSRLKADPWANCSIEPGTQRGVVPEPLQRDGSPLDVKSNYAEIFDNEVGSYSGNVKMARADQQASSNTANYDSVSEVLDLHGDVYYSENELALHSGTATLKLAADQAKLRDVQFIVPTTPLRGLAKTVYQDSKTLSRYEDVAYTSCRPGNQDWVVHASELKINKTTGKGAAKNTWIEFKSAPVFYFPYLSFPIDNRRLSGFLAPVFGSTQNSGFNISAPYYWNIAPNYDATLSPRYLTKRGALLAGKVRYLTGQSQGITNVEYMPSDNETNKARYQASVKNITQFTPHLKSKVDLNYVSDKKYFAELGNALSFPNFSYLRSDADMRYDDKGIALIGRIENYQAINATIPDASLPYRKLPQINLNLDHAFKFMPLYAAMENEFVYFQHNDLVTSQRINTKPSVSIPLQTASAFFTPKVSLQHTQYFLNSGPTGTPDSISRTLPLFSADSGLFFERDLNIADSSYLHTLEPRLFYLYVPYTHQQNIPVFDTAQYDFSYNSMFRENSFSGTDRIQNANQVTAALTSRLIDAKSGRETLKLSIGEIFYFRDRNVTLPFNPVNINNSSNLIIGLNGLSADTRDVSNLVTELSSELTNHISIGTGLQWNPSSNDVERGQAVLHYKNKADEIVNIGYLYRQNPLIPNRLNDVIQSDLSFRWPLFDNWYALGRWQYSLLYNTTQEGFFGVEKENCCWRFRIIGRHYINNINNINVANINTIGNSNQVVEGTSQNGIFFQIELKGLTGIGAKLDTFFEKNLYGYRKSQDDY